VKNTTKLQRKFSLFWFVKNLGSQKFVLNWLGH